MCGIVACLTEQPAVSYLLAGLSKLEYRGYDSAGVSVLTDRSCAVIRSVDRVSGLSEQVSSWDGDPLGRAGIGHTRWATHGNVSESNAHPHRDCSGRVTVVHNGIIENAVELREVLVARGHHFSSDVDSEVVCHLIEDALDDDRDLVGAVRSATARLSGSWALAVMDATTGRVVGTAHGSPLLFATSPHGSFLASDASALTEWIDDYQALRDGDIVDLDTGAWNSADDTASAPPVWVVDRGADESVMSGYTDFMQKEIEEQPQVAARIIDELAAASASGALWHDLGNLPFSRLAVIGCGTSLNAGKVVAQAFGRLGGIPHQALIASECTDTLERDTLVLAFSQSGETADILRAIDNVAVFGMPIVAMTNNEHSTLARRSDSVVLCRAGQEIGVAATKTFTAQVITGVCIALSALVARGTIDRATASRLADDLRHLPDLLAQSIAVSQDVIPPLIESLLDSSGYLFLGRGSGVVYADEGALKLKELTYRWAESYPAGELKHGPLALVEEGTPVIVVDNDDPRLPANISEVEARGGRVIRIGRSGSTIPALGMSIDRPLAGGLELWGPLEAVIPLQILARELALGLGRDVDKPRNLAKSVTVD